MSQSQSQSQSHIDRTIITIATSLPCVALYARNQYSPRPSTERNRSALNTGHSGQHIHANPLYITRVQKPNMCQQVYHTQTHSSSHKLRTVLLVILVTVSVIVHDHHRRGDRGEGGHVPPKIREKFFRAIIT